jgi:hypothetical protein
VLTTRCAIDCLGTPRTASAVDGVVKTYLLVEVLANELVSRCVRVEDQPRRQQRKGRHSFALGGRCWVILCIYFVIQSSSIARQNVVRAYLSIKSNPSTSRVRRPEYSSQNTAVLAHLRISQDSARAHEPTSTSHAQAHSFFNGSMHSHKISISSVVNFRKKIPF